MTAENGSEGMTAESVDNFLGDIPSGEFRDAMHRVADLVADYLENVAEQPVLPGIEPGTVRNQLPAAPPELPESLQEILGDYRAIIEPNTTHWNHPGFMAYFAVTGSGPGILGETLAGALNVNAMLWRTGPSATELEEVTCGWLRDAMGLPKEYWGLINDTASIGSIVALATARHRLPGLDIRRKGLAGRRDLPTLTVYASEQAHSSIDKAVLTLGLGLDNLRKIPVDDAYQMRPDALAKQIEQDIATGNRPLAVVATVGTTSTTSVDPVPAIAEIARKYDLWLHVDAAYAGVAAMVPELREVMPGLEQADSLVTNPHKWMFVPVDCAILFVREPDLVREAFSEVPHYLTTPEKGVRNLMDYGVQLGRRMRALKMWFVMRAFGLSGLRDRIRYHCEIASEFAEQIRGDDRFELMAPVPMNTVCFRATPATLSPNEQDDFNERLLTRVNAAGPVFVSHTQLRDRFVMRLCAGNLRTRREHLRTAWQLILEAYEATEAGA